MGRISRLQAASRSMIRLVCGHLKMGVVRNGTHERERTKCSHYGITKEPLAHRDALEIVFGRILGGEFDHGSFGIRHCSVRTCNPKMPDQISGIGFVSSAQMSSTMWRAQASSITLSFSPKTSACPVSCTVLFRYLLPGL